MIREMTLEDVEQVSYIDQSSFEKEHADMDHLMYELSENPYAHLLVYEKDHRIIGYIDYWITFETAQLAQLAVLPQMRKTGIAHRLMDAMISACEQAMCEGITLEVRVGNEAAIRLYEAYDFMRVTVRHGYYQDGEDAVLMMKPLGGNYV